ncbi:MAG: hypothetical protein R2828_29705 [Saprospiraceae bacterium]
MVSYTDERLSADLGIDIGTLRKAMSRKGFDVEKGELLEKEVVEVIAEAYSRPHAKRGEETEMAAKKILSDIREANVAPIAIVEKKERNAPVKKPSEKRSRIDDFFRSRVLLFSVFLLALFFQMEHSALVAAKVSQLNNEVLRIISGVVFAIAVQFTGLIMTIHSGRKAYLIGFALVEFLTNMLYYAPWSEPSITYDIWAIDIIISAAIAFTILSYAELFAASKTNDHV